MKRITDFISRHKILTITVLAIVMYLLVRLVFIPPIVSQTMFSHAYYDRDGQLMRLTLAADDKYRLYTPLSNIAPDASRAIILYEDKYFYIHPGINPISLIRAASGYFRGVPHPAGASTITMQVARIRYNINTKHPAGKLKQIAAAIYMDAFHSKREIIEAYLNLAPYGGNIEGIGAASLIFFHKRANELSTIESITLATIPQNPSKRNISTKTGHENIMQMRADLIRRWTKEYGMDDKLQTMADMPIAVMGTRDLPFSAPHFVNREISNHGGRATAIGPHVTEVITTLDTALQSEMTRTMNNQIAMRRDQGVQNAAAILLNYKTMQVLGYIGSNNYFDQSIFGENDGVRARRSPGSTLKPLIYAAAADAGLIHGMTLLKDARVNFGVYAPENADSEFYGPVLAHSALTHSRNIPAINLLRQIGIKNFHTLLGRAGVDNLKSPQYYGVSVALGGAEVSMWELADIYATMANLGRRRAIKTDMTAPDTDIDTLLSPEAYFLTLDMLGHQRDLTPTHQFERRAPRLRHYWKTGTSSSYRDAWTAGIFGDFVLIVWVGNFDGRPNNAFSGAKTAAPIYFAIADSITQYYARTGAPLQNNNFLRDDLNISQIEMCDIVGGIAGTHCPHTRMAYFIPGKSPIEISSVYRAVPIDNQTGRRACNYDPATTHMAVYEFWDSEYLDMFRRAGVTRNTPPSYMPGCDLGTISNARPSPIITSPADGSRIVILSATDTEPVSLRAITDMGDAKIFWFLDGDVIGTSMPGEAIIRNIPIGRHTLRAIDEMGAATDTQFTVIK
ncbi:penicillin-binding protein 1C [bacterium]|nr:penicillin-binding protein 1C [bacterium]